MRSSLLVAILLLSSTVSAATREPAMAGSFYPEDPAELRAQVTAMLDVGEVRTGARALVVPHAGYVYSGPVAGRVFATLGGSRLERVILLGPSHHQGFAGAALPDPKITAFSTPLGDVQLDVEATARLRREGDFSGPASAHVPEHSLEVELPFLQVVAPQARIVPILLGHATTLETAARIAASLLPLIDDRTAVIVSSDFTHHGPRYGWTPFEGDDLGDQLVRLGRQTAGRLAAMDPVGFTQQVEVSGDTVCGVRPAMVLAQLLAHAFDGRGEVLDVTTSGHRSGRWDLSVTYAGITFFGHWTKWKDDPQPKLGTLSSTEGAEIVALARAALTSYLVHDGSIADWYATASDRSVGRCPAGAFVTLNRRGTEVGDPRRLRACMGVVEAEQPLAQAVVQAAVWAAQDPRFPRLEPEELGEVDVEISILSPSRPVGGPEDIEIGTHGVILTKGTHRALFLPQVATEQGWDRRQMLDQLARKAGLPAGGWRSGARFEVFTAQVHGEGH